MIVLSILLSLLSVAAQAADFSGHWASTEGRVSSTIGWNGSCSRIEIVLKQTPDALVTEKYQADCQNYDTKWGPVHQQIRDGKVFEQEEEVGTFDGATLLTTSRDGSVTYIYNLQMSTDANGNPVLQSRYGVSNFAGQIYTDAPMHKVSP